MLLLCPIIASVDAARAAVCFANYFSLLSGTEQSVSDVSASAPRAIETVARIRVGN